MSLFSSWPVYFRSSLKTISQNGFIGIVTGWSKPDYVFSLIPTDLIQKVAVIGPLYSKEGSNYIVRNVFLNPKLTFLIICGEDLSHSLSFFSEFLQSSGGIEGNVWQKEIPVEKLLGFRQFFCSHSSFSSFENLAESIQRAQSSAQWIERTVTFPEEKIPECTAFPSERAAFRVSASSISDLWLRCLDRVIKFGEQKPTQYGGFQRELVSLIAVLYGDDDGNEIPEFFPCKREDVESYLPTILSAKVPNGVAYTYGSRLRDSVDQIGNIINELKKDSFSRRAFASTWDPLKDPTSQLPPCLTSIQCLIQKGELFLTAYFRSNDIFSAWPLNAIAIRKIQIEIANGIGVNIGPMVIHSNSAHIYDRDFTRADETVKRFKPSLECTTDPRGNFLIEVVKETKTIKVILATTDGKRLKEFRGSSAMELRDQISPFISEIAHAIYLGEELMRAEISLQNGTDFVQDAGRST